MLSVVGCATAENRSPASEKIRDMQIEKIDRHMQKYERFGNWSQMNKPEN